VTLKIYEDLTQGTDEWLEARRGILTASVVGKLITPKTVTVAHNDTARALMSSLAAERITGKSEPVFVSDDMMRGTMEEPIARELYSEWRGVHVDQVGFMTDDILGHKAGYSPDGLVGDNGLLEIKSRRQRVQLETIINDNVPTYNVAQLQMGLLISGREWIDYVSFSSGMPLYVKRVHPDQKWFDAIAQAVDVFEEYAEKIISKYEESTRGMPTCPETNFNEEIQL
jgi:hypothetical protein